LRKESLAFLGGVILFQQLTVLPDILWALLLPLLVPLFFVLPGYRVVIIVASAFLWTLWHANMILATALDPAHEGVDLVVQGQIADIPEKFSKSVRFRFAVDSMTYLGKAHQAPGLVRLSWYGRAPALNAGERWQLKIRLKQPHGFMNPGGFDYEGWLYQNRLRATGYVRKDPANQHLIGGDARFSLNALRQDVLKSITAALPDNASRGIVTALAIGVRKEISLHQWKVLTMTGTSHLVAISGLHIGLVAGMCFLITSRLWSRMGSLPLYWPSSKVAALAAMLGATVYAALAGFSIPTQRALVMVVVVMLSLLLQRQRRSGDILASALLLVLMFDPLAVMSAGFWLSFTAVAVILFTMSNRLAWRGWMRWGRIHLVMALGLAPLLLVFFQQVPLLSPLANFVAVPLVSLIVVPLVMAGTLSLLFLPALGQLLLNLATIILNQLLLPTLDWLAVQDIALWRQHAPLAWTLFPAGIGALLLLSPRGIPGRWIGILWLLPMLMLTPPRPKEGELWFTLLDVGQGLAAVVRTRDHVMVYDAGPRFSRRFDAGSAVLLPFFRHYGISYIDLLVLGHGDSDHIGGAEALFENIDIGLVISSVPEKIDRHTPVPRGVVNECGSGQQWRWNGIAFRIIHPVEGDESAGNNASCVLQIGPPGNRILLTGDIEKGTERRLVENFGQDLRARFLVVPHHGSKTSSSTGFLTAVRPEYALIPAGYRNRFGLPAAEVTLRYADAGARQFNTAHDGAVSLQLDSMGGFDAPKSYRQENLRYWHWQ